MKKTLSIMLLIMVLLVTSCKSDTPQPSQIPLDEPQTISPVEETKPLENTDEDVLKPFTGDLATLSVDEVYLDQLIQSLSSHEMTGRLPGTQGNQLAGDLIKAEMIKSGLSAPDFAGDYTHSFSMVSPIKGSATTLSVSDAKGQSLKTFIFGTDFVEYASRTTTSRKGAIEAPLVLVNTAQAIKDAPEGSVLLFDKVISPVDALSLIGYAKKDFKGVLIPSKYQNSGEFLVNVYMKNLGADSKNNGPLVYLITPQVQETLKTMMTDQDLVISASTDITLTDITAQNIIGYLPGRLDEGYIITAHFDHLGDNFDGTMNLGALDNASGTAAMLALAQALGQVKDLEKSIYFIAFNGEEQGLLGSEAFVREGFFEDKTYQVINLDMIGASDHQPISIDTTSDRSHSLAESLMQAFKNEGFKTKQTTYGFSDHFSFEQEGYEALLLIELDERYYHTKNDTYEIAIDVTRLRDITNVVYKWLVLKSVLQ